MPTATSTTSFILRSPTKTELTSIRTLHASCWAGPLTITQYLAREDRIASTSLTCNGGLTQWVLVDSTSTLLASCEAIRKKAVISYPPTDGEKVVPVEEVVAYGIGSVFTPPECRGKGYARIMLTMLGERLKSLDGENTGFSVLYSDIGKEFYAKLGWLPHRSSHINIPVPAPTPLASTARVQPLYHTDIEALCELDMANVKASLSTRYPKPRIAFLPDHGSMDWHHNREEFMSCCVRPTLGKPTVKGTITADGKRWIVWNRDFSVDDPKLYILRVVDLGEDEGRDEDMVAMLRAAVDEAAKWELKKVCAWNPDNHVLEAAKKVVGRDVRVEDRETSSIASLMMYSEEKVGSGPEDVTWVVNEKFAWC